MGDRPRPGSHPHHPHCHRHPPVQEVSAVLRTPGGGHLPLDSQALPGRVYPGPEQPRQPAPRPRLSGDQEEQKQCVCTWACCLGVIRSLSLTQGWFTCIRGRVCPLVSVSVDVCLCLSFKTLPSPGLLPSAPPVLLFLDGSLAWLSRLGLGRPRPACPQICTWQTFIECSLDRGILSCPILGAS